MADASKQPKDRSTLYRNIPLKSADSIRVLSLKPGEFGEPLYLKLNIVQLDSKPKYEALSYTWGRRKESRVVHINGSLLPVTDNLYCALQRLRKRLRTKIMWVDAICINQDDARERSQQVSIMHRIYSSASNVDFWLGEVPKEPSLDFRKLSCEVLNSLMYHIKLRGREQPATLAKEISSIVRQDALAIWQAINNSESPWHKRAWTLQEAVLARNTTLCVGRRRISSSLDRIQIIEQEFSRVVRKTASDLKFITGKNNDFAFHLCKSSSKHYPRWGLEEWLREITKRDCLEPRDKVFSLKGICLPEQAELIEIDYGKPEAQVYTDATLAAMVNSRHKFCDAYNGIPSPDASILAYASIESCSTTDLPSWAIDFANLRVARRRISYGQTRCVHRNILDVRKMIGTPYLTIHGQHCDTICSTIDLVDPSQDLLGAEVARDPEDFPLDPTQGTVSRKSSIDETCRDLSASYFIQRLSRYHKPRKYYATEDHDGFIETIECLEYVSKSPVVQTVIRQLFLWDSAFHWQGLTEFPRSTGSSRTWSQLCRYLCYITDRNFMPELFVTTSGLIGFAPGDIQQDDLLIVPDNGLNFIILRKRPDGNYAFRGPAYVHHVTEDTTFWEDIFDPTMVDWQQFTLR